METIKKQWEEMINRGVMPLFELELALADYLIVNLSIVDRGIAFSFDAPHGVFFDGEIITVNLGSYVLPFDPCFEELDHYLQMIHENVYEGYLIPNNLL